MHKLDGVSIPMIAGDWRLVIAALEDNKLAASLAVNPGSLDDDRAAEVSEGIDRLTGLLRYLKGAFETSYGMKYSHTPPVAGD